MWTTLTTDDMNVDLWTAEDSGHVNNRYISWGMWGVRAWVFKGMQLLKERGGACRREVGHGCEAFIISSAIIH